MKAIITIIFLLIIHSCKFGQEIPFDSELWIEDGNEGGYPEKRELMLDDLLKNYHLKGKTYQEIQHLLGRDLSGNDDMDDRILQYNVITDFRWNIDPMYTKDLFIYFSKDSVVTGYKVKEWDRDVE